MIKSIKQKINNLIFDKKFSDILTGTVWVLIARIIATAMGFIGSIIIARWYGADVIGIIAVIQSLLMIITIFTVMGTNTSLLRLLPEYKIRYSYASARQIYHKIFLIVVTFAALASIIVFFSSDFISKYIFSKPYLSFYFSFSAFFLIFKSLSEINPPAIRGLQLIKPFAVMQTLPQGFNLLFIIVVGALWANKDVPIYALFFSITGTSIIGFLIIEHVFVKNVKPHDKLIKITMKEIFTVSLPMLMTATMTLVIGQTGVIILGVFRNEKEVGYYAIAVKLGTMTVFITRAINSMAGPKFSQLFYSNKIDELFYVAKKSAKLIFWTTTPILIVLIVFGQLILKYTFGSEFIVAYPALVLISIGQFVHSVSGATGYFMNMTGNHVVFRNIVAFYAIVNIAINLLLIPRYGIYGAATTAMICLIGWNVATLIYIKNKYGKTTGYFPSLQLFRKQN